MQGFATADSTSLFSKRFPEVNEDFFKTLEGLHISSVGVGSFVPEPYKEENYVYSFKDALIQAVLKGCNVIDTAINYRCQKSEREVGEALAELKDIHWILREELFICTKAGFIPLDFPFPQNPYEWIEENMLIPNRAQKEEIIIDQHCLSPMFLRWSLEQSLKNMQVGCVDVFYIHNPEMQLGYVDDKEFFKRMQKAFEMCEKLVEEGKIKAYGIASWNGFLYDDDNMEYISLNKMVNLAEKAGGKGHHLKYLQIPYNLAKPHPYNYTNQKLDDGQYYTCFQAAKKLGIHVFTSSSLLRMNLFKRPFSKKVGALLGEYEMSDIHRAIQFARSPEDVACALFSSKDSEHISHNMMINKIPLANPQDYARIFSL